MSKLPSTTATPTTHKLHTPNYADISSNNNDKQDKQYMIHSPSSIDLPHKTTPSTTTSSPPSPTSTSPSKKDLSSIANVSSHSINNKGIKQKKSVKFQQSDDDNKFFTRLGKIFKIFINYVYKKLSRIIELMSYLRLILALTLYSLILIDVIHVHEKKEKENWIEILTQAINAKFVFLTIIGYPKRIRNLQRAIRIWCASRRGEIPTINSYSSKYTEIQKIQISVANDYKWYVYDTLDFSLNCTPIKLLSILLIWNIGSLAQFGISGILWFIPQTKRPEIPYLILTIIALISELGPIPVVVIQSKRAKMAKKFEIRHSFKYSIQNS